MNAALLLLGKYLAMRRARAPAPAPSAQRIGAP